MSKELTRSDYFYTTGLSFKVSSVLPYQRDWSDLHLMFFNINTNYISCVGCLLRLSIDPHNRSWSNTSVIDVDVIAQLIPFHTTDMAVHGYMGVAGDEDNVPAGIDNPLQLIITAEIGLSVTAFGIVGQQGGMAEDDVPASFAYVQMCA